MSSRALRRAVLIVLALGVIVALLLGAFLSAPPPPRPAPFVRAARLVVSLPRAEPVRARSESVANAVRLAVAELNGKVLTDDAIYEIDVAVLDSAGPDGTWSEAAERANIDTAVADREVVAYIGPGTLAAARLVAPIAAKADLAVITPTLTAPGLTRRGFDDGLFDAVHPGGVNVFARVIPADDVQAAAMARLAKEEGARTFVVVADASPFASSLSRAFTAAAVRHGLAAAGPGADFLYATGQQPDVLGDRIATERRGSRAGGNEVLLADNFLQRAGRAAEGVRATFVGRPLDKYAGRAADFLRAYRDRHARDPDPYAIFGYEAARLALDAVPRAGADRARVRSAIFGARDVAGALGTWSIDERGDTTFDTYQLFVARALPGGTIAWTWEGEIRP